MLKPSSFGDIIHTLPAVARLKTAWPECRVSWLVNPEWSPLLDGNPDVSEIIPFPRGEFRGWAGGWRLLRWLRSRAIRRPFDLALDFQGLLRTALAARASGAREVMGLSDAREGATWLYQRTVPSPRQPVHAAVRYLTLAEAALPDTPGVGQGPSTVDSDSLLPVGEGVDLPEDFKSGFVLLHPYARGRGKSLPEEVICEFLREFRGLRVVLVGRGDARLAGYDGRYLNLLNQTSIAQLIWLVRRATFVVSVDSGPAHLAAALRRPMVAIHSWSDPRRVGPYCQEAWVWKNGCLVQVRDLAKMKPDFFEPRPLALRAEDIAAIAALATTSP